jgi:glutamate 5-kinase
VACNVEADLLIILSDIEGLYDADPRTNPSARLIGEVSEITEAMLDGSRTKGTSISSGGMLTKLLAARMTMVGGIPMVVASSAVPGVIRRVADGESVGTLFLPSGKGYASKRKWIAVGSNASGILTVDSGAEEALLRRGKSLLPSGVERIDGDFSVGDVVAVRNAAGLEIARGIINYGRDDAVRIMGRRSSEIEALLGRHDFDELIHRNNMAILM